MHGCVPAVSDHILHLTYGRGTAEGTACRHRRPRQHSHNAQTHKDPRRFFWNEGTGTLQRLQRGAARDAAERDIRFHALSARNHRQTAVGTPPRNIILLQQHVTDSRIACVPRPQNHLNARLGVSRFSHNVGKRIHRRTDKHVPAACHTRLPRSEQPLGELQHLPQHDTHSRLSVPVHFPHNSLLRRQ